MFLRFKMKLQHIFLLLLLQQVTSLDPLFKIFTASRQFISRGTKYKNDQVFDTKRFLQEYDFIIVGAGTAGSIVANRLSENPNHSVLLIEAGEDENYALTIPALSPYFFLTKLNWGHEGERENACLAYVGKRCSYPRGKVLGGTSVLNGMFFTRGNRRDFERWEEMGNRGWGYFDILPYYKKMEDIQIPEYHSEFRGVGGPTPISFTPFKSKLGNLFVKTLEDIGYGNIDFNARYQTGVSNAQYNMLNGSRYSTNRAYLMPIKYRKNLHIAKNAYVTKILIDPFTKETKGVEFRKNRRKYQIYNRKELILSAGTFGSAQLLMLSGIGPEEHLKQLRIPVIQDLKVGYNLQDHVSFGGLLFLLDYPLSVNFKDIVNNLPNELEEYFTRQRGPMSTSLGSNTVAFVNSRLNNDTSYPDIELIFGSTGVTQDPLAYYLAGIRRSIYDKIFKPVQHFSAFSILPVLLRPKSIGRMTLKSNNPFQLPRIKANYFDDEEDLDVLVEGIKMAIEVGESDEFKLYGARLHKYKMPGCNYEFGTNEFWKCALRQLTLVSHHFCGTAKMGPETDPDAVVDPELRVYGIKGLRVVDASIMPFVPTAHTNAPVMMIAEKAADMIKNSWEF